MLSEEALELLEYKYPDWLDIISLYEYYEENYEEKNFIKWTLYIYYKKNNEYIIDIWYWVNTNIYYMFMPYGYLETYEYNKNNYKISSFTEFMKCNYNRQYIAPHLFANIIR